MKFPVKISTGDLAQVIGVNERTITKLVCKKILRREARGCFDLTDAVQDYVTHREGIVAAEYGVGTYGKARAQLYLEKARAARIRREELEGTLAPVSEWRALLTSLAAVMRNRVLAIGPKTATRLVRLNSAAEAQAIVSAECREALEELSRVEIRTRCKSPAA
jgi:hypothetical protein